MPVRRVHVARVRQGSTTLGEREAHHVRDVLRLAVGDAVETFDDAGTIGSATLTAVTPSSVVVSIDAVRDASMAPFRFRIASAVPKAARADWLVEKISELGAEAFVPLATARSVALPEGGNKLQRWRRLAEEAARQSRRNGVMRIEPLTPLAVAIDKAIGEGDAWLLSTGGDATPVGKVPSPHVRSLLTAFIGPEGGWTAEELAMFKRANVPEVSLTPTAVLRVETAAVAVAAVLAAWAPIDPI
jgi:16S rRNA (uracil1498-N3)-methyltransferase